MSPPYTRRQYSGGAVATSVNGGLTNTTAVFDVADGSTFPSATFFCVIDEALATEEKIFVAARSGNTFSSVLRGEDGTTALPHSAGATIRHVFVAQDADEANFIATVMTVKGDLMARGATAPVRLPSGAFGWLLSVNPTTESGLQWTDDDFFVQDSDFTARGDLIVGTAASANTTLPVGANGKVLTADTVGFPATHIGYAYPIATLTAVQIAALAGADLWDGRQVYDTTNERPLIYNATAAAWRGVRATWFGALGTNGSSVASLTELVTATLVIPDQGCAGLVTLWGRCFMTKTLGEAAYMQIRSGSVAGPILGQDRSDIGQSATSHSFTLHTTDNMAAGASKTFVLTLARQGAASGTYSFFADPTIHRLDAIFTPTP